MDAQSLCHLLLGTDQLVIEQISVGSDQIGVSVASMANQANCPKCKTISTEVHSTYTRFPSDLAWAEWAVVLHLQVKRFFCRNNRCPKRTFAEPFPDLVGRYARRTNRVVERQKRIGVEVCARSAERLLKLIRIGISDTTVNRLIRSMALEPAVSVRVLGVDDWAKRKGQNYGTILVDLEQGEIVDVLPDRTAETLAEWLVQRTGIEIVTRDRSPTYADAIRQGAPEAVQVADRWHLLKNLSDVVFKILQREYRIIKKQLAKTHEKGGARCHQGELATAQGNVSSQELTPAEQRRKERMELAQQLHKQGWTQKEIARHLNIDRKTVSRYLRSLSAKAWRHRKSRRLLDPFKSYILKRWNEGCLNAAQLFREIQSKGYRGKKTTVRDFVRQLRQASGLPPRVRNRKGQSLDADPTRQPTTLRSLTWAIVRRPEERTTDDERVLARMSEGHARLTVTIKLAREFAAIIRDQQAERLDEWLQAARECGVQIWSNFAAGLDRDYDAVRAALLLKWSNDLVAYYTSFAV